MTPQVKRYRSNLQASRKQFRRMRQVALRCRLGTMADCGRILTDAPNHTHVVPRHSHLCAHVGVLCLGGSLYIFPASLGLAVSCKQFHTSSVHVSWPCCLEERVWLIALSADAKASLQSAHEEIMGSVRDNHKKVQDPFPYLITCCYQGAPRRPFFSFVLFRCVGVCTCTPWADSL